MYYVMKILQGLAYNMPEHILRQCAQNMLYCMLISPLIEKE